MPSNGKAETLACAKVFDVTGAFAVVPWSTRRDIDEGTRTDGVTDVARACADTNVVDSGVDDAGYILVSDSLGFPRLTSLRRSRRPDPGYRPWLSV